jgi:hypothetical protein
MTIAEVCDHFVQRELTKDNLWRSYSTKKAYRAYLNRWVIPHWGSVRLSEVKTTEVESWLRSLPLAKSSCAKIRGILSVLFNHACRHELFDRNPIRLVRQGAKRRSTPSVLTPAEIKVLISGLGLRERTLVLHVPAYILDFAAECWDRIQSDAGAVAAFFVTIHVGCLHASHLASKTRCSSSGARSSVCFRNQLCRYGAKRRHKMSGAQAKTALVDEKGCKKGAETHPFAPSLVAVKLVQLFWNEWRGRRDSNSRPLP